MTEIAHFIDNARVAGTSGRSLPVFNPATGATEKTVALASPADVDRAVASAAWPTWAKTPPMRRPPKVGPTCPPATRVRELWNSPA